MLKSMSIECSPCPKGNENSQNRSRGTSSKMFEHLQDGLSEIIESCQESDSVSDLSSIQRSPAALAPIPYSPMRQ